MLQITFTVICYVCIRLHYVFEKLSDLERDLDGQSARKSLTSAMVSLQASSGVQMLHDLKVEGQWLRPKEDRYTSVPISALQLTPSR
jgi:hypothetical protein